MWEEIKNDRDNNNIEYNDDMDSIKLMECNKCI